MSSGVFVIKKDGSLVEMQQTDYDSEDMLQKLLAEYPTLLAGNLINEVNPRKWILISREFGVPDNIYRGNRWSVDHLFLDQDGVPTLVEVKRSDDTRIRREVVGQMLEYAANAVQHWDINRLKTFFEERCIQTGKEPQDEWQEVLEPDGEYDEYWESVKSNLQNGKLRLVFVADEIPFELKRIVEFLNENMKNIEVLAIEIKQYIGQDQTTLIPRVYGQTIKSLSRSSKPNPSIEEHLGKIHNEKIRNIALKIKEMLLNISSDISEKSTQYHIVYKKNGRNIVRMYPKQESVWLDIYVPVDYIQVDGLNITKLQHISHFEVFDDTNLELIKKALQITYDYIFVNNK